MYLAITCLLLCAACMRAQVYTPGRDASSTSVADTTIRLTMEESGRDSAASRAWVSWWVREAPRRDGAVRLGMDPVEFLERGGYAASAPFFDTDDRGLFCVMTLTNVHATKAPPLRLRVRIDRVGSASEEVLDDAALRAAESYVDALQSSHVAAGRIPMTGSVVVDVEDNTTIAESPWVVVRDTQQPGVDIFEAFGNLKGAYTSPTDAGAIEIALRAFECCAGTKAFYERYLIHPGTRSVRLLERVMFMYELESPRQLLKVARSFTVGAQAKLVMSTTGAPLDAELLSEIEHRVWTDGVALVPGSTAWIVALDERVNTTWAFVVGKPVVTPDVKKMFVSDNSSEPGMVAGWMKIAP